MIAVVLPTQITSRNLLC